jgi:hypothetical protein
MKRARLDCTEWLANRIALSAFNAPASEPGHFFVPAGADWLCAWPPRVRVSGEVQVPIMPLAASPFERTIDQLSVRLCHCAFDQKPFPICHCAFDIKPVPMCHCAFDSKSVRLCHRAFDQKPFPICHCAFDIFPHGALSDSVTEKSSLCEAMYGRRRDLTAFSVGASSALRVSV